MEATEGIFFFFLIKQSQINIRKQNVKGGSGFLYTLATKINISKKTQHKLDYIQARKMFKSGK
jgi:hypothetical protein